jgi:hypothetical protein
MIPTMPVVQGIVLDCLPLGALIGVADLFATELESSSESPASVALLAKRGDAGAGD